MATEYISKETGCQYLRKYKIEDGASSIMYDKGFNDGIETAISCIGNEVPAADVRPVVHGNWNVVEKPLEKATICECSECKHRIWMYDGDDGWNYCPHCGAEMRAANDRPYEGTDSSAGSE